MYAQEGTLPPRGTSEHYYEGGTADSIAQRFLAYIVIAGSLLSDLTTCNTNENRAMNMEGFTYKRNGPIKLPP